MISEQKERILSGGKGAAFVLAPSHGFLEPFQTQEIEVLAYSDIWGQYRDTITIAIEG